MVITQWQQLLVHKKPKKNIKLPSIDIYAPRFTSTLRHKLLQELYSMECQYLWTRILAIYQRCPLTSGLGL